MSTFEFFMAFYGLLLGLALAELMTGFGALLRLRERPVWGFFTPLAGACVMITVVTAFADAWMSLKGVSINMRGLAAPTLLAMCLFLAAIMTAPRDVAEWPSLDAYFLARRRVILLPLVGSIMITIFSFEAPLMVAEHRAPSVSYIIINLLLIGLLVTAAIVRRRRVIIASLVGYLAIMFIIYFSSLTISGLFNSLFGAG